MDGLNSCQGFTTESDSLCLHKKSIPVKYMDAFVKQIPLLETIFGNIKKPPDIICVRSVLVYSWIKDCFYILRRLMDNRSE